MHIPREFEWEQTFENVSPDFLAWVEKFEDAAIKILLFEVGNRMGKAKIYKASKDFLGFTPEIPLFKHSIIKMLLERHKDEFENALAEVWVDEKDPAMYVIRIQDGPPSPAFPKEVAMDSNTPQYLPMATSEDEALALQLKGLKIVRHYVQSKLDRSDPEAKFQVFPVWFSKTLQNWKMLASTTLNDQMYYEVTHNGDLGETYVDAYKKWENVKYLDGWDEVKEV